MPAARDPKTGRYVKRSVKRSSRRKVKARKGSAKTTPASMAPVTKAFRSVRAKMAKGFAPLRGVGLGVDPAIHDSPRHFARTGKVSGGAVMVMVAPELAAEPVSVIRGVLAHELGHAAALLGFRKMPSKGTKALARYDLIERQADRIAKALSGWHIYYDKRGVEVAGPGARGRKLRPKGLK